LHKKVNYYLFLFFFIFSFFSAGVTKPLLAEETVPQENLIKVIEVNQALSYIKDIQTGDLSLNQDLVAGKDTAILVRLSQNVAVDTQNKTQTVEVSHNGVLVTTLTPSPQNEPSNCLVFEPNTREEAQNWAAGNYKFTAKIGSSELTRDAQFTTRRVLNVLAVPVKANYGGVVKDVTGAWKQAGNYTAQLFPVSTEGFNWVQGQDLDCSDIEYDLKTDDGQKKLWESLCNLQVKDENGNNKYELIIGFVLDRQGATGTTQGYTYGKPANIVTESDKDMWATVAHEIAHCYGIGDEYTGGSIRMSINPAPLGMTGTDWDSSAAIAASNQYFKPYGGSSGSEGSSIKEEIPFDFASREQLPEKASFMGSNGIQSDYWISAPIWKQLFTSFAPLPSLETMQSSSTTVSKRSVSLLEEKQTIPVVDASGWINKNDAIPVDCTDPWYSYTIPTSSFISNTGAYSIQAKNNAGTILGSQSFDLRFVEMGTTPKQLEEVPVENCIVPFPLGTTKFVFTHNGQSIGEKAVSLHAPVVEIKSPIPGQTVSSQTNITWTASDVDNDPLTYEVLYSHNGKDWISIASDLTTKNFTYDFSDPDLPGGSQALINVIASDGVRCTEALSATFSVSVKQPELYFLTPEDLTLPMSYYKNEEILFEADAYDVQDESLTDQNLVWTDASGAVLGKGSYILLDKAPGSYAVTLTATNSAGAKTQQTIQFTVKNEEDPDAFHPLNNATDELSVDATKVWRIKLSQAVNPTSVTPENVYVSYINSSDIEENCLVDFSYEDNNKTIVISPKTPTTYKQGEHYTLWVKDLKTASKGSNLKTRIYRDFTIK